MSTETIETVSYAHLQDAGDALKATVDAMPPQARDDFLQELMMALYAHSETGDEARLARVVKGLLISTSLHARPDYAAALAAAEVHDWEPASDVADYLSKLHESRSHS